MVDRIANKEPEEIDWAHTLSPLEHKLFGSTPFNMSIASVNSLIEEATEGSEDAIIKLLSPIASDEGADKLLIEKARRNRRQIGPNIIFGTRESLGDSFPLKDYTLYVRMGKLSDQGLAEGFDVEFVRGQEDYPALLDENIILSLLNIFTRERVEENNTVRQLSKKNSLKVSFSNENTATTMHFRYNFRNKEYKNNATI